MATGSTVVALAAVILLASALSDPVATGGPPKQQVETPASLLDRADFALASGDTTRAVLLARKVLEDDPDNKKAKAIVDRNTGGQNPDDDGDPVDDDGRPTDDDSGQPKTDKAFLADIENLSAFLPKDFSGYSMGFVAAIGDNADVSAVPAGSGAKAFRIAWGVRDRQTESAAKSYITKTSRTLYSKNPDDKIQIDGASAYFGTDGTELATVAYVRGRYVFEVVVVAEKQGSPESMKSLATEAARAFADSPPK